MANEKINCKGVGMQIGETIAEETKDRPMCDTRAQRGQLATDTAATRGFRNA